MDMNITWICGKGFDQDMCMVLNKFVYRKNVLNALLQYHYDSLCYDSLINAAASVNLELLVNIWH